MVGSDPVGNGRGSRAVWKTWWRAGYLQEDQEEQSLFSCYIKYKTLKNNTTSGTDPRQLRGCCRFFRDAEEHVRGAGTGAGILNSSVPLKISWKALS